MPNFNIFVGVEHFKVKWNLAHCFSYRSVHALIIQHCNRLLFLLLPFRGRLANWNSSILTIALKSFFYLLHFSAFVRSCATSLRSLQEVINASVSFIVIVVWLNFFVIMSYTQTFLSIYGFDYFFPFISKSEHNHGLKLSVPSSFFLFFLTFE